MGIQPSQDAFLRPRLARHRRRAPLCISHPRIHHIHLRLHPPQRRRPRLRRLQHRQTNPEPEPNEQLHRRRYRPPSDQLQPLNLRPAARGRFPRLGHDYGTGGRAA
jgi:hypothetical protein